MQREHGWSPAEFSALFLIAGSVGVLGTMAGGRGSDRFGRRRVGFWFFVLAPPFAALFYTGSASILGVAWALWILCISAGVVVLRTFVAELFGEEQRGASIGWLYATQTLGATLGLVTIGTATSAGLDFVSAVTAISFGTALAGVALLLLPETTTRSSAATREADG